LHDLDFEHVHDVLENMAEEDHPLWQTDHIALTSAGIDVGSATAQVMFSRLHLRRMGQDLSSRYVVVSRELLYLSPIYFTPYQETADPESGMPLIDSQRLAAWIRQTYQAAGLEPEAIDTGAVILTGEAIRRPNAHAIAELLAAEGGQFVCATAGHHMESLLAAHGSGAARLSHDRQARVLNIDIGGGTTKLALIDHGHIRGTAAIHLGGRLAAVDAEDRLIRLEPQGQWLASQVGLSWKVGMRASRDDRQRVGNWMAEALSRLLMGTGGPELASLWLTPPLEGLDRVEAVTFSGGVGEYVYDPALSDYGDLGAAFGRALAESSASWPWPRWETKERIRATVVGASQYSVQVSGNTIYVSDPAVLPLRNVAVIRPHLHLHREVAADDVARRIAEHLDRFDLADGHAPVVLAVSWEGDPSYSRVSRLVEGIINGLTPVLGKGHPLALVFDRDIARLVGAMVHEEYALDNPLVVVDGIQLRDFDFVDIGRLLEASGTVPITIKSLVFQL
jgi:ethanolamine utilization protein EutA